MPVSNKIKNLFRKSFLLFLTNILQNNHSNKNNFHFSNKSLFHPKKIAKIENN